MSREHLMNVQGDGVREVLFEAYCDRNAKNQLVESPQFWVGTQGAYDALPTKNSNTLYLIVEGEPETTRLTTLDAAQVIPNQAVRQAFLQGFKGGQPGNQLRRSPAFWSGTQGDFDALTVKDPNTVYLITA